MPAALLATLLRFAGSRPGNIVIAFAIAWVWGQHRAAVHYERRAEAARLAQRVAHAQEMAREAEAARDIAAAATARAGEDALAARAMQAKIDELQSELSHGPHLSPAPQSKDRAGAPAPAMSLRVPCAVDDAYARRVRELDAAGARAPAPARRAR